MRLPSSTLQIFPPPCPQNRTFLIPSYEPVENYGLWHCADQNLNSPSLLRTRVTLAHTSAVTIRFLECSMVKRTIWETFSKRWKVTSGHTMMGEEGSLSLCEKSLFSVLGSFSDPMEEYHSQLLDGSWLPRITASSQKQYPGNHGPEVIRVYF